jgi:hypothetical protein
MKCRHLETVDWHRCFVVNPSRRFDGPWEGVKEGAGEVLAPSGAEDRAPSGAAVVAPSGAWG